MVGTMSARLLPWLVRLAVLLWLCTHAASAYG
jgi:hypothetical protein